MGQVGADHRRLQVAKVYPQDSLGHAHRTFVTFIVLDQFTQVDWRRELHTGLAPQDQDAQQPAQAPGDGPAVGEQQFQGLDSLAGDWPQNTLTGMIWAFSSACSVRVLTRRVKVGGAPRLSWRPSQSGSGVR